MAWDKREAIRRREEARQQPYNNPEQPVQPVDSWERNSGANTGSAISRRETASYTANRNARKLATDWIDSATSYLQSGRADDKTREALSKQYNGITNYLKTWGKDIGASTLDEINTALDGVNAYLDPSTARQAYQNGHISAREYDRIMTGNSSIDSLAGRYMVNFDRYAAENPTQYANNVRAYGDLANAEYARSLLSEAPELKRDIISQGVDRAKSYDEASRLANLVNNNGIPSSLTEEEQDEIARRLGYWQNDPTVSKNSRLDVTNGDLNLTDYDYVPEFKSGLPTTSNELGAAFDTVNTNRRASTIQNILDNDAEAATRYYSTYAADRGSLNGSYNPQEISDAATYPEKVTYGYLKETEGEKAARQYWRSLKGDLVQRAARNRVDETQETLRNLAHSVLPIEMWNEGDKVAEGTGNLATQLSANAGTIVGSLASPLTYLPGLDGTRQRTAEMLQFANAVKAQNAQEVAGDNKIARVLWEGASSGIENVVEAAIAGKVADAFGYGAVPSQAIQSANGTMMGEQLLAQQATREAIVTNFVTLGMSSGATLSAIEEAKTKGYNDDEATIRGLVSGAIEYVTEKVGMDGVFKAVKEGKGALMALVKSGLAEGSEELVGNQLDRLTTALMDAITGKSVTETQKEVRKYIAQGMSEEEAMQQVILDNVDEDIEAFASAFFSAGMSAAGYGALTGADIRDYVNQNIDNIIDSDNNIVDQEALEGLIETGMSEEFSKSTQRKAEALQQKLANGEEITQKEVKSLYTENVKETRSDRFEDTDVPEQTTAESLKTPSNLAELLQREQTSRNYANLKETLGSEGQKLFDNAINEAIQNRADRSQAVREVTNVYNAGAGVTDTYTATHLTAETRQALYKAGVADRSTYAAQEATNRLVRNMNAGVQKSDIVKQAIRDGQIRNDTVQSLDRLGKALGTRYEIHASSKDYNGQYDPGSATIHLFLDSNILKGEVNTDKIIRATVGHELTHRMQSLSSKHYEALTQSVVQAMGANRFNSAIAEYRAKAPNLSNAQLQDEVVADFIGKEIFTDDTFIGRMVNGITNSDMTVEEKKTGLQKLKDIFSRIRNWLTGNGTKAQINRLREVEKRIDDVLKAGIENLSSAEVRMERDMSEISDAQFSIKYKDDIANRQLQYYENNQRKLPSNFGDILDQSIADMKEMADLMEEHQDILPADKVGKVLIKNGSYDISVENTTICVRTLAYNQFVDMVQDKVGRPLTQMESFLVSQKMYDIAKEPQCLYCYVSLDRKAYTEMINRYIDDRDSAINAYEKADKPKLPKNFLTSEDASNKFALYKEFLNGRKNTTNMRVRYADWINAYNDGVKLLTKYDLRTEALRSGLAQNGSATDQAQLKDVLKYAQSASWAKKQMDYVAYNGDILKLSQNAVNNLNKHYGLRFYSFSDYSGAFIVENMQQITDASLRGLKGLAYTKDTDFVEIFAPSGININISVFAKMNPATGQYEIDPLQSADIQKAIELRNNYDNVGIVVVATDVAGVEWALAQEWSDVVIPFHTVRTGADVADFYNWDVFTSEQADKVKDQNMWDAYLDSLKLSDKARKKVSKDIYPSEHNNDRKTYLDLIRQRGLSPRFERFLDNPNYMKLVNETRKSAADTPAMQPVFDLEAAKRSFQKFADKGGYYEGWYNEGVDVESEAQTVANDVLAGRKANEVDYGRQDINPEEIAKSRKTNRQHMRNSVKDSDYMDAVNNGDMETAQRMVKEAAAQAGYTVEGYHGTQQFGFTKADTSYSDDKLSFFVTNDLETARTYSAEEGVRQIKEGGTSEEELQERMDKALDDAEDSIINFADAVSREVGIQGWLDIDQQLKNVKQMVEDDMPNTDDIDADLYDWLDGIMYDVFLATEDSEQIDFADWEDTDTGARLYALGEEVAQSYLKWARAVMQDTVAGNYHVFINPTGLLEIDAKGARWNQIEFIPQEIQEIISRIAEIEKKYTDADTSDSLPWDMPEDNKSALKNDKEWRELSNRLDKLISKYHWEYMGATSNTRRLARYASENDFRGVVFKNVIDDGGYGSKRVKNPADVYALFYPQEQVKSADPVTYDNNGNVIPLSERFNEKNEDIRYSLKEVEPVQPTTDDWKRGRTYADIKQEFPGLWDTESDDADSKNPTSVKITEKSYRKYYDYLKDKGFTGRILDASSGLGYGAEVGRNEYGFDVEDIEPYPQPGRQPSLGTDYSAVNDTFDFIISNAVLNVLPQDQRDALVVKMGEMLNPGGDMVINVRTPADISAAKSKVPIDGDTTAWYISSTGSYQKGFTFNELKSYLLDALGGEYTVSKTNFGGGVTVLVHKNENADTRYSRKNAPQLDFKTAVQLQEINTQLKGEVERLRTEFKRRPIDVKDFSQRITRTIREYQGTVDAQEIIDSMLPSAREFMKNPNKSNEAKLYGVIQNAAHRIITTALARDEFSEAAQVKEFLKGRRIKISPKTQSDFGDWMRDYHRRYFGNIYFTTNKGTSVEDTYTELQQQFGEGMFPSYIQNPTAQLERILEIYEAAESYSNPYDGMTAEAIESLEMQLVADVMDTTVKHTYADKQYEKREQLRKEMQEKMNDRIAQIRAERDQKFADLKAHYREVAENARERRSEREIRHRLLNVAQRLERVKTTAANRALIESLIGDLDTISMGMTGQGFENLQNLSRWYDSIMEDPDFVRDPNIEEKIKRLNKKHINGITRSIGTYATMADAKLAQQNYDGDGTTNIRKTPDGYVVTAHEDVMSIEDVRDLLDVLLNVENEIQTAKHLIDVEDRRDTFAMAQQIVEDIRQSAGVKDVTAMFDRYIVQGTLSPERAIHRYTGYVENDPLYLATKNLSSGQRNMLDYQYRANKKFLKFTEDGKFMDEITGKKAKALKYKMTNIQGNEVEVAITPAMRISLYLHSLNPQNLRHIVVGGLTIPTWKDYTKGKLTTAYAGGTVVRLTPSEIRSITSQMTTKEMALAREVYNYFNGMSQDAINAVSEKLKGYALARVSDYFPINTDDNFLHKEFGKLKENGTIQGMGFLQERNKKAVNPVRLRDVTDVLKQSIDMTSKYVGLAIPVSNINKLLNAQAGVWDKETETWKVETAVKKELSLKWKDKSIDYIEKLIGDLQNPINTQEDLDKVLSKVRSNYAGAVLTLNLSVAMKQAASYPTAAAVVGWKPLAKAMTQFGSVDLDLIARYTPLQWYRTQGYSTQELGDIKSRGKLMSNLPKALNWIQAVDLATTRKLWKAAEIYVQENNKALSVGTDEYYKTVAEIYNQIIEETQPNYTTMQRPEMLRSNSPMIQAISMFKTQPFQNFNITFDAVANYLAKKTADKNLNTEQSHAEFLKAQKRLSWAVTSQVAQLFTFAAMTLLWNALRGKWKKYKDKDGNLNAGTVTTGVAKDMASSLFSEVPFGAEAWGFISSKLFGDTYYGFDSVSVSALNDMVSAFSKAGTAISDFVGKDDEDEKDEKKRDVNSLRLSLDSAAKAITKVFGIPYENVENLFNIGFMNIAERLAPAFGGNKYEGHMAYLRLTVDPNKYKSDYYDNLIAAYENDKEAYKGIYDEMVKMDAFATSTKTAEENITAKVDEYMQEKYNLKVKPSKYEGVKPETLQKISEALVKADANNADETKRNESFDQNEIYNALMELALDKQTTEKVWEIEYGGKTSWDEYASKQETKAEAAEDRNKALDKVGLTPEDFETYISSMDSVTQANAYDVLKNSNFTTTQRRTLWTLSKDTPWSKTYDEYEKSQQKKTTKKQETKKEEPKEEPKEETRNDVGYTSVSSSVLSGYEYHNGVLTVTLNSGRTYSYNVSQETFDAFEAADSKGSFWNNYIK